MEAVFSANALRFASVEAVLQRFQQWRETFPEEWARATGVRRGYDNAYGGLALPEFLGVLVVPSLLALDPLELAEEPAPHAVHDLPWFPAVARFCETTGSPRDATVLARLVQKMVVPVVNVGAGGAREA